MFQKTKSEPAAGAEWFTLAMMASAFDITPQAFAKSVRPLLSETDVKNDGRRGVRIRCRAAIDRWAEHKAAQAAEAARKTADPLLVGVDSPALERYRSHRADLAQMEVEAKKKTHADLAQLNEALTRFASCFRRAGDVLQRRFGPDAVGILNDALDQAAREWEASSK